MQYLKTILRTKRLVSAFLLVSFVVAGLTFAPSTTHAARAAIVSGQATYATPDLVVASSGALDAFYTGIDQANHLNVTGTFNGQGFYGPTVLTDRAYPQTGPAVCSYNGAMEVVWVGADAHLNVAVYTGSNVLSSKYTFSIDASYNTPACAVSNGRFWIAWTGRNGGPYHNLNLWWSTAPNSSWPSSQKITLTDQTSVGPAISAAPFDSSHLYMGTTVPGFLQYAWGYFHGTPTLAACTTPTKPLIYQTEDVKFAQWGSSLYMAVAGVAGGSNGELAILTFTSCAGPYSWRFVNQAANHGFALAAWHNALWMAWGGWDSNLSLNVAPV
ncbi:MAG TPA: hypothetical protein VH593_19100 [Ktedonobacteraceae bacterium]